MQAHEAAELFPMMLEPELQQLAADIQAHGLRQKIVLHDGKILDGRNRYQACCRVGVSPDCVQWDGAGGNPIEFVISQNLKRRHLDAGQRSAIADSLAKPFEDDAERRRLQNLKNSHSLDGADLPHRETPGRSIEKAAAAMQVSATSAKKFRAIKKRDPELAAKVVAGEVSLDAAFKQARPIAADSGEPNRKADNVHDGACPCDESGNPIPKHLIAVFEARDEFDAVLSKVKILSQVCLSLSNRAGGERIRWNELKTDIDNLRRHLRFARPYSICPYCDGTDKACKACKGTGWITEAATKQAPKTEAVG
jgi:hypothetical protein